MQIKFKIEEIMIMDALVGDAAQAAKPHDKLVYNKGKRICQKLAINAPVINLKRSELIIIGDIVEHTINMGLSQDTKEYTEDELENREENLNHMRSALDSIVDKLNEV